MGFADYVVSFRKPGDNENPVSGMFDRFHGETDEAAGGLDINQDGYERYCRNMKPNQKPWPLESWRSIMVWQRYASPVWSDIRQTRTLQYRSRKRETARFATRRHLLCFRFDQMMPPLPPTTAGRSSATLAR